MNFLGTSFKVARIFGINVRVHILFVIWIAYSLYEARDRADEALFLGLLFGTVLLHEFGHCFGARLVGGYAENILMWPLGGLAYAHAPMRPWPQFVTVAAGPLVNVILCLLSAAAILLGSGGMLLPGINPIHLGIHAVRELPAFSPVLTERWLDLLVTFYHVNLFLLAFNLLPIFPLDGGQLFHAIIWPFVGLQRASVIACYVGLAGCAVFGLLGLRQVQQGSMLFFIAIFGGFICWQRLQAARHGLLAEDSRFEAYHGPSYDPRPWWQRVFRTGHRRRPPASSPIEFGNPNPGGWVARQADRAAEEAELDRILKKVSELGVRSLSYVERQTLERITRERQTEERQYQRDRRV
jgi:Zn-dependent protease